VNYPSLNASTRWGLSAVLLMGVVFALYFGHLIFVPMVIALMLVAVLWPVTSWVNTSITMPGVISSGTFPWISFRLVQRQLPWGITCVIVIALLVALILLVPLGLGMALNNILKDVPRDAYQLQKVYTNFRVRMIDSSVVPGDESVLPESADQLPLLRGIQEMLNPNTPQFSQMLTNVLGYGGTWLVEGVLIMFMLLFLLLEGRLLSKRVVEIFGPSPEAQGKAVTVLENIAEQVRVYLVWRTIVNFGLALVLGIVYYIMGLHYTWQWALLTALLCYVPYLGQIVAGFPPFIDSLLNSPSPWMAIAVLAIYVVVMTIEGYVIVPLVMGRSMQLNAITVLLACSFWFLVWGTPGLFLAMPLMAAIKAVCANVPGWEVWANLMSTVDPEPKPSPPEPVTSPAYAGDTEVMTPEEAQAHRAALEAVQRHREGT
jgi:AI-2 transport protein TqsA